jgi:hypothetical protein
VFEPYHILLIDVDFSCSAHVYRTVIWVKGQPFRVWSSSSWEHRLFKSGKDICSEIVTIQFCIRREFVDNMKSKSISRHCINMNFSCECRSQALDWHHLWSGSTFGVENRNHLVRIPGSLFFQFGGQPIREPT